MKHLSIMIKPASSLCNLRCKYCFYANVSDLREIKSFGIMSKETVITLLEKVFLELNSGDNLNIAFQGGEPTLAGLDFFTFLSDKVDEYLSDKKVNVQYAIQTNGFNISDEFYIYLKKYNYLVGLSIDLHKEYHNLNRVDTMGNGTFSQVITTKSKLEEYEISHNVLCVLTNPLAKHPQKVWNFIEKNKLEFIQFIPCLGDLDDEQYSNLALTSKNFYSFYSNILPLWYNAIKKEKHISIKFFDDLFHLIINKQVNSCGFTGKCGIQLVVEADGSVYPCDFYVLDKWKLGDFYNNTITEMQNSPMAKEFLSRRTELPKLCENCKYINICAGGCERMSKEMYASKSYCGYQIFLKENQKLIEDVAGYLVKNM